jgi:O-antigen ligase
VFIFSAVVLVFVALLPNDDFRFLILSKLNFGKSTVTNNADISRRDRVNSLVTALKIGANNPIIGVGISNYARHSHNYSEVPLKANFKGIANNIYAEIFAEVGVIGLFLFIYLLFLLYKKAQLDKSGIMKWGLLVTYIYFFAFPTFTILFIWVFFGLVNSFTS